MSPKVISNSSPIIGLSQISRLDLLQQLFGTIYVPPAVVQEANPTLPQLPGWAISHNLSQPLVPQVLQASLGAGESEAISLALELAPSLIILDDRQARRLAQILKLPVIGIIGILVSARQRGMIPLLKPELDKLLNFHFYISSDLYSQALRRVGE